MKLSRCMTDLLERVARDRRLYVPSWCRQETRTASALEQRGLVVGTPRSAGGGAHYTITDQGRLALSEGER